MVENGLVSKLGLLARIWWFGPLSGGSIAIGLTNCVGISLSLLFYLSSLTQFSINLLVVIFCSCLLLMANLLLLYGSVKSKPHLLLPWLVTTSLSTMALLVYTAINWEELDQFKAVIVGVAIFSLYFCAVVASFYHELVASRDREAKEKEEEDLGVGTPMDGGQVINIEETVLVTLEQEEDSPSPGLPCPDEVIPVNHVIPIASNNPFYSDVFKVKQKQQSSESSSDQFDIQSDFTPFKKSQAGGSSQTPAKMRVFLPGGEDESDFDFSFNDPDFDSSLCAVKHPEVD
eukprot:GFUD01030129.1.p1 GENE.GFUD01030129.1~~GFUD01030129.1.p1  ORF type:complete len:288 (+),score=98.42 GFUD01030129.1:404-1267(+)